MTIDTYRDRLSPPLSLTPDERARLALITEREQATDRLISDMDALVTKILMGGRP